VAVVNGILQILQFQLKLFGATKCFYKIRVNELVRRINWVTVCL